jgi:hypothetical protein
MIIALCIGFTVLLFAGFLRGAPYVPTHHRAVEVALDLLNLPKGSTVVDLGSGDGSFLIAAARRGLKTYGYEINPLLCIIAWCRSFKYRDLIQVRLRDFWLSELPPETDGVFVFLGEIFMPSLAKKLDVFVKDHQKPLYLVSYGFALPDKKPLQLKDGLYLYQLDGM